MQFYLSPNLISPPAHIIILTKQTTKLSTHPLLPERSMALLAMEEVAARNMVRVFLCEAKKQGETTHERGGDLIVVGRTTDGR
jgi:hypothetical protein